MAAFEPPKNWTEQDREHYLQQVMRSGWTRMRPYSLLFLLLGVGIAERGATPEDLKRGVRNADNPEGNLDASCWENPEDLDDEERAQQATHVEDAERYAAAYGRPPLRTTPMSWTFSWRQAPSTRCPTEPACRASTPRSPCLRPQMCSP